MKKHLFCAILITTSLTLPCYALQIKSAIDHQPIKAVISTQELTRISVEDDKISNVVGISGLYLLQNDEQGAVFIRPTAIAKEKKLNLFVSTKSGHNYILQLNPKNIQAETIILKSNGSVTKSPYQQNLVRLITTMINRTISDEYSVTNVVSKRPQYKINKAKIFLTSVYQNDELRGEVYRLVNKGKKPITISEQQFYREGVQAVALQDHTVLPAEEIFVYLVLNPITSKEVNL